MNGIDGFLNRQVYPIISPFINQLPSIPEEEEETEDLIIEEENGQTHKT